MRRLSALMLLVLLAALPSPAQEPSPLAPEVLIRRAHALSANLPLVNRAWLLAFILDKSPRPLRPETQEWAEEAFTLSLQLPLDKRNDVQFSAIRTMSQWDPDRALDMLNRMEVAPSSAGRSSVAVGVFGAMLRKHGDAVLPALLQAVNRLASTGSYPYVAVMGLFRYFTPEQRDAMFVNAVNAYENSAPTVAGDTEFVTLLKAVAPRITAPTAKAAAPRLAVRLLRYAESDAACGYDLRFYSEKGVGILECGDAMLWEALPALRLMDAARADGVVANRRALQQVTLTPQKPGSPMRMAKPAPTVAADQRLAGFDESSMVRQTARTDVEKAIQLLSTVKDDNFRLNATVLVALEAAEKNPARARQLMNEVLAKVPNLEDLEWKIVVLTNVAHVANTLQEPAIVESSIKTVFGLGPRYIEESKKVDPDRQLVRAYNGYKLGLITRVGARVLPKLTLEQVNGIADEEARAYLLLAMADAISHPESKY